MSIAKRFTLYTFLIVFFFGCVFTCLKVITEYSQETERISREINQIRKSHVPFLISSLWLTNYNLLQTQVNSIAEFLYIDRVMVLDDEGTCFSSPWPDDKEINDTDYEIHREELTYEYKNAEIPVGELTLFINIKKLKVDIIDGEIQFFIFQFLAAAVIAVSISLLFNTMVGKHLRRFADFLKSDDFANLPNPYSIFGNKNGNDELAYLMRSVNTMRKKLHKYLVEKELLLKEVHHRIKNNMASMEGLLQIQADEVKNVEASQFLLEAKNRFHSMNVLYDKLYRMGTGTAMPVKTYLAPLLEEIIALYPGKKEIELKMSFDHMILDSKLLSSLGIMLNELMTNSLKHAFPHVAGGIIRVELIKKSQSEIEFVYSDNGVGMPDSVFSKSQPGLGMVLIQLLAEQINGTLVLRRERGTEVRIIFPAPTLRTGD